jgi:MarR family transcriptional regulator, organic hydroperoxide resistance regulator
VQFRDSEVFKLHELVIRLDAYAQRVLLSPIGLTYPEFLVLMAVGEGTPATHQVVAGRIGASKSLVSQRVKTLEGKGMLRQGTNPENRREHFLSMTPRGSRMLSRAYAALLDASEDVFGPLGRERGALNRMLDGMLAEMGRKEQALVTKKAQPRNQATVRLPAAAPREADRR